MKKALFAILLVLLATSVSAAVTTIPAEVQLGITNQARGTDIISSFNIIADASGSTGVVVSFIGVDTKYAMSVLLADGTTYAATTTDDIGTSATKIYTIKGTIPTDENSGKHQIGSISIVHDGTTTLVPLVINPISKLKITDIDVKHGEKTSKNLVDGSSFDDVFVGDELEFEIEVSNLFTKTEDTEFEDVEVKVTLVGIDDDEDDDKDTEISKIKEADEQSTTISFTVPFEAEEDTYEVIIEVVGDSDLGDHSDTVTLSMEVEKPKHGLTITNFNIDPIVFSCNENANIDIKVVNYGTSDEDARITILASEFDFSYLKYAELSDDVDDSDSKYSESISFTVPKNTPAGEYSAVAVVYYDDTEIDDEATFTIQKSECKPPAPAVQVTQTQLPPVQEYVIEENNSPLFGSGLFMGLIALTLFLAIVIEAKFLISRPLSKVRKVRTR